jgi:hypothetical protein
MGCGDSSTETHTWNNNTTEIKMKDPSAEEVHERQGLAWIGEQQKAGLSDFANFARTGDYLALDPQHQAQLDKAFDASRQQLQLEGKDYADFLSGSRGLRMSDTPVSQQALQRYGLGLSSLESNRALPSGSVFAHNAFMGNRLAQPTTYSQGTGNTTVHNNPSLLTQMNQGAQFRYTMHAGTNQATQAGSNMMGMGLFG